MNVPCTFRIFMYMAMVQHIINCKYVVNMKKSEDHHCTLFCSVAYRNSLKIEI